MNARRAHIKAEYRNRLDRSEASDMKSPKKVSALAREHYDRSRGSYKNDLRDVVTNYNNR